MKALKKKELFVLKAIINAFSQEVRRISNNKICYSFNEERMNARNQKHQLGLCARFHMLAYAFMLGKRYDDIEKNKPLFFNKWQTFTAAAEILSIVEKYSGPRIQQVRKESLKEAILFWLKTGENVAFTWSEPTPENNVDSKQENSLMLGKSILRMYVLVRQDITPGYQIAQSVHAKDQFTHDFPSEENRWYTESNTIAVLGVENERALKQYARRAKSEGLKFSLFYEPDIRAYTALAIEPGNATTTLCAELKSAGKGYQKITT